MSKGPVIMALVGGLVAGYFIGNLTSGGAAEDETTAPEDLSDRVAELERESRTAKTARREAESALRDAQRRETEARARAETAEASLAEARAAQASDGEVTADAPATEAFPVFDPQGLEAKAHAALTETEWSAIGGHMSAMPSALADLATSTLAGTPPDAKTIQVVQENNSPLAMTAVRLMGGGVPGTGANGAFTHPGFLINAMAAALEAAEMPLDDRQKQRFASLGDDFMGRYATQLDRYDDDTLTLRKMVDETELKQDLVVKLRRELSAAQVAALSPDSVRDHVGIDLFSAGIIWVGRLRRFEHSSRDDLVAKLQDELLRSVPDSDRAAGRAEIQAWVDNLPNDFLEHSSDALERRGWGTLERTMACAKQMLALVERLVERGQLPDAVKANLAGTQGTLVLDRPTAE